MRAEKTLWVLEDALLDEQSDMMEVPEFRQRVGHELHDEDLGVRSLLEHPEVLRDVASWRGKRGD